MRRSVCIYNPTSRGGFRQSTLPEVQRRLYEHGFDVEFKATEHPLHAVELARNAVDAGADLVIAAGGDGTVNEVVNGLARSHVPLAILPAGTANVLATDLGLTGSVLGAVDLIPTLKPIRIALGKGGERYFVAMAGVGLDAAIIYELNATLKRKLGEVAFWLQGFRSWTRYRFAPLSAHVDGKVLKCTFLIAARTPGYGARFRIAPGAHLMTNHFDVCMFTSKSRLRYLNYLLAVLSGRHLHLDDVTYLQATQLRVSSPHQIRVQMDGELVGSLPMEFQIVPDALTLLVPPRFAS